MGRTLVVISSRTEGCVFDFLFLHLQSSSKAAFRDAASDSRGPDQIKLPHKTQLQAETTANLRYSPHSICTVLIGSSLIRWG